MSSPKFLNQRKKERGNRNGNVKRKKRDGRISCVSSLMRWRHIRLHKAPEISLLSLLIFNLVKVMIGIYSLSPLDGREIMMKGIYFLPLFTFQLLCFRRRSVQCSCIHTGPWVGWRERFHLPHWKLFFPKGLAAVVKGIMVHSILRTQKRRMTAEYNNDKTT